MGQLWDDRTPVKKGALGEAIIKSLLESKRLNIYKSVTYGAHAFDMFVMKDKETFFIVEVKTKPARLYYPDTGFDLRHFKEYKKISDKHKILIFIFFVDEIAGKIYGNYLHILERETPVEHNGEIIIYPWDHNGIIYFPLKIMRQFGDLDEGQIKEIKQLSTSNYKPLFIVDTTYIKRPSPPQ